MVLACMRLGFPGKEAHALRGFPGKEVRPRRNFTLGSAETQSHGAVRFPNGILLPRLSSGMPNSQVLVRSKWR